MPPSSFGAGFYPQPNEWTCGPVALKHALLALGRTVDVVRLRDTAKTHWWSGTNEVQMTRAARAVGCDLVLHRRTDPESARKMLVSHLRARTPVLLCVEEWSHWVTVFRVEDGRFVVADSTDDPPLSLRTWSQMWRWWRYREPATEGAPSRTLYDLMAVVPHVQTRVRADLSVRRVRYLRRPENRGLAHHWDEYLQDLLQICRPRASVMASPVSMGEFLRRHQRLLIERVVHWHGEIAQDDVRKLLRWLRFVSETYKLVIPAGMTRRALADLAVLAALYACARHGVDGMFGALGTRARPTPIPPKPKSRSKSKGRSGR